MEALNPGAARVLSPLTWTGPPKKPAHPRRGRDGLGTRRRRESSLAASPVMGAGYPRCGRIQRRRRRRSTAVAPRASRDIDIGSGTVPVIQVL